MSIKTQGTQIYIIDPDSCEVLPINCVTAISGISATRDQLETTCLENDSRTYEAGLKTPGQAQFTINFDPKDASHKRVYELYTEGTKFEMAIGYGDGIKDSNGDMDAPTVDTACLFNLPDTRSWAVVHQVFFADVPQDFALNAIVTANVAIQLSGDVTISERTAT